MQLDVENQLEKVTGAIKEIDNRINEIFGYRANNIIARPYKINWKDETIDIVYKIIMIYFKLITPTIHQTIHRKFSYILYYFYLFNFN